ncbi:MAG: hypothetical protein ABSF65_02080 [Candidatus Bathyarchaeia archaeon]|jgi:hypothetical protein
MSETFEGFMCKYIQGQTAIFKKYLLAALDSQDKSLCYLDMSMGTPLPSMDVKNCELLTDAGLFREEVKTTRDGRNRYELFYLTDLGMEMVEKIKEQNYTENIPQSLQVAGSASEQTKLQQ